MSINDDGFVSLLDMDTCEEKNDLKMPEGEMGTGIRDAFEKDESGILVKIYNFCLFLIFFFCNLNF